MFSAFTNSLKIPELRSRIFYTLALLFVARVGAVIPLPGIDPHPLQNFFADQTAAGGGALVGLYNMFTGVYQRFDHLSVDDRRGSRS